MITKAKSKRTAEGDYIFAGEKLGRALNLPNLVRRVILPMIKGKVEWKGWHAFRHGLATNLLSLRVDLVTIAAILRHSVGRTTLLHPASTDEATRAAMSKMEDWIKAIDHEGDGEPK